MNSPWLMMLTGATKRSSVKKRQRTVALPHKDPYPRAGFEKHDVW